MPSSKDREEKTITSGYFSEERDQYIPIVLNGGLIRSANQLNRQANPAEDINFPTRARSHVEQVSRLQAVWCDLTELAVIAALEALSGAAKADFGHLLSSSEAEQSPRLLNACCGFLQRQV